MVDLGRKVRPSQCDAKQKLHTGHDAVAMADTHARLGQVQLKTTHIIRCGSVRRSLQKCSETLAAGDVTPLRVRTKFARAHVLDHALAQRADRIRTHGWLLSRMRLTTSIPRQATRPRYRRSLTWLTLPGQAVPPAIAQRFSALAHCCLGHLAPHVRNWGKQTP